MPASRTWTGANETAITRLDALGSELTRLGWDARLITGTRPHPALLIRDPAPGAPAISEHVYAVELGRHWFYWWTRGCGHDPADAARIITRVMRFSAQTPLLASVSRPQGPR